MHKNIFFLIALFSISLGFKTKTEFNLVNLNSTLLVDITEIKNIDWREYMNWLENKYGKNSTTYQQALPDTTVWIDKNAHNEPYVTYYYQHPAYGQYPIVGISYEQAIAYCNWRSDRVNEFLYKKKHKNDSTNNFTKVYTFRLPTKQEWISFASIEMDKKSIRKVKKQFSNNSKTTDGITICGNFYSNLSNQSFTLNDNADITAPAKSYLPNNLGIYNTFGNVAEMVSEKGVAMGGHFHEEIDNYYIEKEFIYDAPTQWLGFRCVAEISN